MFSANWYLMHGVGRRSISVEELMLIAHPDDQATVQRAYDDVIRNGKPFNYSIGSFVRIPAKCGIYM